MNDIFKLFLSMSVSGTIVALVAVALKTALKSKLSQAWQYYVWLIVVARLLIPFTPEVSLVGELFYRAETAISGRESGETAATEWYGSGDWRQVGEEAPAAREFGGDSPAPLSETVSTSAVQGAAGDLAGSLWLLWLAVALAAFVRKVTSYHSFTRYIRAGSKEVNDPALLWVYADVCREYGMRRDLPLYVNTLVSSPMLVGMFRPAIVLPEMGASDEEYRHILRHELMHYRRMDGLYKWAVQIAVCLHWFNPAAYLVSREMNRACELSCDEAVIKRLDNEGKIGYGDTLLSTIKAEKGYHSSVASITLGEDARLLKERLAAIIEFGQERWWRMPAALGLTVALVLGAAYAGAYAAGARSLAITARVNIAEDFPATTIEQVEFKEVTLPGNTHYVEVTVPEIDIPEIVIPEITIPDIPVFNATGDNWPYYISYRHTNTSGQGITSSFANEQAVTAHLVIATTAGRLDFTIIDGEGNVRFAKQNVSAFNGTLELAPGDYTITMNAVNHTGRIFLINQGSGGTEEPLGESTGQPTTVNENVYTVDVSPLGSGEIVPIGEVELQVGDQVVCAVSAKGTGTLAAGFVRKGENLEDPQSTSYFTMADMTGQGILDGSMQVSESLGSGEFILYVRVMGKGSFERVNGAITVNKTQYNSRVMTMDLDSLEPGEIVYLGHCTLAEGMVIEREVTATGNSGLYVGFKKERGDGTSYLVHGTDGEDPKLEHTLTVNAEYEGDYYLCVQNRGKETLRNIRGEVRIL